MKKIAFVLMLVCSFGAAAKGYSVATTPTANGGFGVKFASDGTPLAVPPSMLPSGNVGVTSPHDLSLPGLIKYPLVATAAITAASMGGPWGMVLAAGITAGSIGVAALDQALASAKIRIKPAGAGLEASDPNICTVAPCPGYFVSAHSITPVMATRAELPPWLQSNGPAFEQGKATYALDATSQNVIRFWEGVRADSYAIQVTTIAPKPSVYQNITIVDAVGMLTGRAPTQAEVQAMVTLNFPPVPSPPVITGPPSVFKGNTVQLGVNGQITEIEERYIASFSPGIVGIGVQTKQTVTTAAGIQTSTTTNSNGTTSTSVITTAPSVFTTTTVAPLQPSTSPSTAPAPPAITCGLPGTPACKMDETGTASSAGTTYDSTKAAIDTARESAKTSIDGAAGIAAPTWSFSFQFPTGCAPYVTGIRGFILNVCPFQAQIHSLLSAIWAAATAFAIIGMVGRTIRGE